MEKLKKYYASLKQATDYLEDIKRLTKSQSEIYEVFKQRLEELYGVDEDKEDENLRKCGDSLKKNKKSKLWHLILVYILDNALFLGGMVLINYFFTLSIPLFIPLMVAVFFFMLTDDDIIKSFVHTKDMSKKIEEAKEFLGSEKLDESLVDLMNELDAAIKSNEAFIESFNQAISEYMSLLLAQENRMLPYGPKVITDEDIKVLEEGLKKLNLNYKEREKHE